MVAPGVRGGDRARAVPPSPKLVRPQLVPRRGRPRRRDRWRDAAVHGRGGTAPARHRECAGVPRPADRRRTAEPRPADLARARLCRSDAADPAVARFGRRPRRPVRTRRGRLLGGVHPAHPACRRQRHRSAGHGRVHSGRRPRRDHRGRSEHDPGDDLAARRHRVRPGAAAAGGPVHPRVPRPAPPRRRRLRHPDEPRTSPRPAHRLDLPQPVPRPPASRRHRLRRRRRHGRRASRTADAQSPRSRTSRPA